MDESSRPKRYWHSDPTTTTIRYSDLDFENPAKAWHPAEHFAENNKNFGTTCSSIRKRRSMDLYNQHQLPNLEGKKL